MDQQPAGWKAPEVERHEPPDVGGERDSLDGWLRFYRDTLLWKCAGLDAEALRARACPPSNMSLLGIVRHLTDVERAWFRQRIGADDSPFRYWRDGEDTDFTEVDSADPAEDFAAFEAECLYSEGVVVGRDLAELISYRNRSGEPFVRDIRWILIHLIEEYARHLGHCDLLRERVDGVTGY